MVLVSSCILVFLSSVSVAIWLERYSAQGPDEQVSEPLRGKSLFSEKFDTSSRMP